MMNLHGHSPKSPEPTEKKAIRALSQDLAEGAHPGSTAVESVLVVLPNPVALVVCETLNFSWVQQAGVRQPLQPPAAARCAGS